LVIGLKSKQPIERKPNGLPNLANQRLAMYIVISKPKRILQAVGFSHFILILLVELIRDMRLTAATAHL